MLLGSADGPGLELVVTGYQFPDLAGGGPRDWDTNWVVVDGTVHAETGESWRFTKPCLTTWESSELEAWLQRVADLARTVRVADPDPDVNPDVDPDVDPEVDPGVNAGVDPGVNAGVDPDAPASVGLAFTEPDLAFRANVTARAELTSPADVAFSTDGSIGAERSAGVDVTVRVRLTHGATPSGSDHPFELEITTSADALDAAARQWGAERSRFPPR